MLVRKLFVLSACLMQLSVLSAEPLHLPEKIDVSKWEVIAEQMKKDRLQPEEVFSVDLSNRGLWTIPSWVFDKLKNLQVLILNNNAIVDLPADIGKLKKLRALWVARNKVRSINADIQNASALQSLDLAANQLPKIPEGIYRLPNLKRLSVNSNRIRGLSSEIGKLKKLESLSLSHNPLQSVPPEIGQLSSLEFLRLSHTQIVGLPKEIEKLASHLLSLVVEERGQYLRRLGLGKKIRRISEENTGNLIGKKRIKEVFGNKAQF